MTSSAHDDRIEVLSVVPMPPPPRVHGENGGGVGRTGSKRTSRGHRKSNSGQSLGTISASVMAEGAVGGAIGGVGVGGGGGELSRTGSSASRRQSGAESSMGRHGSSRRSSSHQGDRHVRRSHSNAERHHRQNSQHHHRQNSYPPPHKSRGQGRSDSRRSRGYTYLVPSPDDQVKTVGAGLHNERGIPLSQVKEPKTEQQKRIARIVMVLATIMLGLSLLLVGVTLSMSDHIDEMASTTTTPVITPPPVNDTASVRKMNGLSTTAPVRYPRPTAVPQQRLTTTSKPTSSELPAL